MIMKKRNNLNVYESGMGPPCTLKAEGERVKKVEFRGRRKTAHPRYE